MYKIHYSSYKTPLEPVSRKRNYMLFFIFTLIVLSGLSWIMIVNLSKPPTDFQNPTEVVIEPGSGVKVIAQNLANARVIRSAHWFTFRTVLAYDPAGFKAGTYNFSKAISVDEVIEKLQRGDAAPQDITVTLAEGRTRTEYADILSDALNNFNPSEFLQLTTDLEGYLFPDTYRFDPNASADEVVERLSDTFEERIRPLNSQIQQHELSVSEIINLASILEKEANSSTSMRMVSGILQNRLSIGMALQADATVGYVLDKPLSELVPADLDRESPYNTYLYIGLPPTPISNPGLMAIEAAVNPIESSYFYYITGNDGVFYYAETYAEHQRNIARHLR